MFKRYFTVLVGSCIVLLVLSIGPLIAAPAARAQSGPSIVLDVGPVAAAIREQGAQLADIARGQATSVVRIADVQATSAATYADVQATSIAELRDTQATSVAQLRDMQATSIAQLVQEAQAQRTAIAEQSATQATEIEGLGQRLANCTVTGTGYIELRASPDSATTQIDIRSIGITLDEALTKNAADVTATKAQLQSFGLADSTILKMSPQVAPVLGDDRTIAAYRVLTPLQVTVANPSSDTGSAVLAQVLVLGGSAFKDVSFSMQDTSALQQQARTQAFSSARTQATQYAQMAQGSLGPIISVSEDVNSRREPLIPGFGKPTIPVAYAQVSVVFGLVGPCGLPTPVGR